MRNSETINERIAEDHAAERSRNLNEAANRIVGKLLGCWPHELSRPFRHEGRIYRVCFKCEKFLSDERYRVYRQVSPSSDEVPVG
jgi:hypothetical protein